MITFHTLRYKNFLSTGDQFTEIDFQKSKTSLVVGQNGAGKSTMLDALSFALFGKAHRNINKAQLVNSINNKGMLVEVSFSVNGSVFKVARGVKPGKFEIWKDEEMINQDSHAKEYQKILEQNIIKLNHKSFHQIVVLGSSSFVPFMQLASQHRREVIEDLLDINVFSKMNSLLKEKISLLKDKIIQNTHELELTKTKIEAQQDHIFELEKISESAKLRKQEELDKQNTELARLEKVINEYDESVYAEMREKITQTHTKLSSLEKYEFQFQQKEQKFNKDIKFYEDNDNCPTCTQEISEQIRSAKRIETDKELAKLEQGQIKLREELKKYKDQLTLQEEDLTQEMTRQQEVVSYRRDVSRIRDKIADLQNYLTQGDTMIDLRAAKEALEDILWQKEALTNIRLQLADERDYNNIITELLKDSGIKTKIIKQYLPVINQLTNQYLQVLDFYVHFDLDESFKETIRSRHRDAFSYDSFSEGEKQRIDLALLFTWRQIAKMKNSVATNLLILDETFDSSLDQDGVENLIKILDTLGDDTNVFVISHKGDLLDNKFENKIEFVKHKNFSKVA